MDIFFIIRCWFNFVVDLYDKKYGMYIKTVRSHRQWGFDVEKKEHIIVSSILKFRRHKRTHTEEVYHKRSFVDIKGRIHPKGWYLLDDHKQQGNYQY